MRFKFKKGDVEEPLELWDIRCGSVFRFAETKTKYDVEGKPESRLWMKTTHPSQGEAISLYGGCVEKFSYNERVFLVDAMLTVVEI